MYNLKRDTDRQTDMTEVITYPRTEVITNGRNEISKFGGTGRERLIQTQLIPSST